MKENTYRTDIDGMRAFAVISVILFHLGFLPNGYLGVDVFFVISGFLITGIVYKETVENRFSVLKFYERRIRRIIPLLLFTSLVALLFGFLVMLPDDLENLSQSVIASSFSLNNVLMCITTADYWAVVNEYKPLMHTWSLGIEEQFYILYPFLFFLLKGNRRKLIVPALVLFTVISLILFLREQNEAQRFYYIQYRFFELAIGGLCAILFSRRKQIGGVTFLSSLLLYFSLLSLLVIILTDIITFNQLKVLLVTAFTGIILVTGNYKSFKKDVYHGIFTSQPVVWIGKISFSLYMWHQIVFAFTRYMIVDEITPFIAVSLSLIILLLSYLSWRFIENPFRDRTKMKTKSVLIIVTSVFVMLTVSSFYIYLIGGVVRDVPELELKAGKIDKLNFFNKNNIHIQYNERNREFDSDFPQTDEPKILIVGSSFGRDFINVLIESGLSKGKCIRYFDEERIFEDKSLIKRINQSDLVFFVSRDYVDHEYFKKIESIFNQKIALEKFWFVGTKDFGFSNGITYNQRRLNPEKLVSMFTVQMKPGVLATHLKMKELWKERYLDLLQFVLADHNQVRVFTPEGKFISQDTVHFTKAGAVFFADKLSFRLKEILNQLLNLSLNRQN